jgi:hypothetical protein
MSGSVTCHDTQVIELLMTFPIQHIDQSRATQYEPVGSKPKVWLDDDAFLFKGELRGTGAELG